MYRQSKKGVSIDGAYIYIYKIKLVDRDLSDLIMYTQFPRPPLSPSPQAPLPQAAPAIPEQ